ncbi:MAG: phosphoglycerate kinase [Syntrophomonadaceae bacterium]
MRSICDADIKGKRVLMRVDFNVPMDKEGNIIDDNKVKASLPSIEYVLKNGGKLILMSHLGRPKGKPDPKYTLKPVATHLGKLLNTEVIMAPDCIGPQVKELADNLAAGQVLLLENVRYHAEEEKNDPQFSQQLAASGDIYINDAFGSAHRAHSSTAGVADLIPAYAGFLMEKEVTMLRKALENPESPRVAILGGSKVADKLGLINNLLGKMDIILIGGGMANTFLKAQGYNIGQSICEDDLLKEAQNLLNQSAQKNTRIVLPVDVVTGTEISKEAAAQVAAVDQVPDNSMILDIGPKTVDEFSQIIASARTIVWNGPLGVYEYPQFAGGTEKIARAIAKSEAVSVIGGGDTAALPVSLGLENEITHISTGGGATLEFLEGRVLPGVESCEK